MFLSKYIFYEFVGSVLEETDGILMGMINFFLLSSRNRWVEAKSYTTTTKSLMGADFLNGNDIFEFLDFFSKFSEMI